MYKLSPKNGVSENRKNLPNILTCKLVYSQTSMNYANET